MTTAYVLFFAICAQTQAPRCLTTAPKRVVRERIATMADCQAASDRYAQAMRRSGIAIPGQEWGLICEPTEVPREIEL